MGFLFPAFLLGALAVALPIALHLLRRDTAPPVPFAAVRLLRGGPQPRARRRTLRDRLLLAARMAALVLLSAAFARPYVAGGTGSEEVAIVAVDRSYSMSAPGRFERALAMAGEEIDAVGAARAIALLAFDDGAEVLSGPGDAAAARAALEHLRAGTGGTAYAPLVTRARELTGSAGGTLTIVGDLQRGWAGGAEGRPAGLAVRLRDVGPLPGNASVQQVRWTDAAISATIASSHDRFAGPARLRVDGESVAETAVTLDASGTVEVEFRHGVPAGAAVAVEIDDPEGLAADNVRYVVAGAHAGRVLVIGDDPRSQAYVTRALIAAADAELPEVHTVPPRGDAQLPAEEWSTARAVVLLSSRSLDHPGRQAIDRLVRSGGGLLVAASDRIDPAVVASLLDWPQLRRARRAAATAPFAATDLRHAIFQPFGGSTATLGDVRFEHAWQLPGDGARVVARFTDGSPALIERPHGAGRVLVFASDLAREWNDFPLHPAFVPFIVESVRYLAGPAPAAEYVVPHVPAAIGPRPGVHVVADSRRVAVNVDLREGSPLRMTADEFLAAFPSPDEEAGHAVGAPGALEVESRQNYWRYGLLLLLAALVVESFMGRAP